MVVPLVLMQVKTENEKSSVQPDDHVKKFELPRNPLPLAEFVRCVQECGIVKDVATIHRLFGAFTDGEWHSGCFKSTIVHYQSRSSSDGPWAKSSPQNCLIWPITGFQNKYQNNNVRQKGVNILI